MGGSRLKISGDGFTGLAAISIGNVIFYLTSANETMTYDSLTVITQPNEGVFTVGVTLDDREVSWRSDESTYLFASDSTPTLTSLSQTSVNGPTEMILLGTRFGESDYLLDVKFGNQTCQVTSVNDTQIVCQLAGLEVGAQTVSVNVNGMILYLEIIILKNLLNIRLLILLGAGLASVDSAVSTVTGVASLTCCVSPSSGSVHGGTRLTIEGNGFSWQTEVKIGSASPCTLLDVQVDRLICMTSSSTEGILPVTIT